MMASSSQADKRIYFPESLNMKFLECYVSAGMHCFGEPTSNGSLMTLVMTGKYLN